MREGGAGGAGGAGGGRGIGGAGKLQWIITRVVYEVATGAWAAG